MHTRRRYATCFGISKIKIKDAYPKKVCHMLWHVRNKKMHTQRRHATWPQGMSKKKKREREKDSPCPEKRNKREMIHTKEFIHHPPKIYIYPHTCTSWSRFMTCFSFGSGFWLSKIWEASLPLYPPYLQLHQKGALGVGRKRKAQK